MTRAGLTARLRCPRCDDVLADAGAVLRCLACGPYPVLGGVPVLLEDPAGWVSRHRDAALASLAERGHLEPETLGVFDAFAGDAAGGEPFSDDWTAHELAGVAGPTPVKGAGQAAMKALRALELQRGAEAWLEQRLPRRVKRALEVGCGVGPRVASLRGRCEQLVVSDLSLRAVLRGVAQGAHGVVMDAQRLAFARGTFELVVAENVVDLLDAPHAFFEGARRALTRGGRLLVVTPEPSLGGPDDGEVERLAREAGFRVKAKADGLPWLRVNSARFVEVYLSLGLELLAS